MESYTNFNVNSILYRYIEESDSIHSRFNKNDTVSDLKQLLSYFRVGTVDLMIVNDLISYVNTRYKIPLIFIIITLFSSLEEGNLCINLDSNKIFYSIPRRLNKYAHKLLKKFLRYLELGYYENVIDYQKGRDKKFKPIIVDNSTKFRLLYFQKYYFHENIVKQQLSAILGASVNNHHDICERKIDSVINKIYSPSLVIRDKSNNPIQKDPLQLKAIRNIFSANLSIISGGPGTGKTSLLTNILRILLRVDIDTSKILLGAPTGRSASRISEAIHSNILSIKNLTPVDAEIAKLHGSTLHKILKYNKHKSNFIYGRTYKLPISVLILDEASMVDVVLMSQILISLDTSTTKLILLGDKDQLPPVGAGHIFADIIAKSLPIKLTVLETVYRSSNNLIELANKINTGKEINIKSSKFKDALNIPNGEWAFVVSDNKLKENINLWIQNHYSKTNFLEKIIKLKNLMDNVVNINENNELKKILKNIFEIIKESTILTLTKDGNTGSNKINRQVAKYVKSIMSASNSTNERVFDGAIIMITQNDYSKSLYNGDIGIIVENQANSEYYAFFNRSGKYLTFMISSLTNWDLAFATTVHKSQGSEFDNVMMILPSSSECKLLTKETLYTGITRAAKRVIIYGNESIFNYAKNRLINREFGSI